MLENIITWLPVVCAVYLPVSFVISYAIAVGLKHVEAVFPYISDTGTFTPESGVFGELLNIYAVISALVVYVKYLQISTYYEEAATKLHRAINVICLILGLLASVGLTLVANFQETRIDTGHKIGTALAFISSALYIYILTALSYRMKDLPGCTSAVRLSRLVLVFLHFISLVTTSVETSISSKELGKKWTMSEVHKAGRWPQSVGGHTDHIVATVGEWLTGILLSTYFLTFVGEFQKFRVTFMKVNYLDSKKEVHDTDSDNSVNLSHHF